MKGENRKWGEREGEKERKREEKLCDCDGGDRMGEEYVIV